jgi:hypothetical protein
MKLDQSLSKIMNAANADDAEDVALRSRLVAAFRATSLFPELDQDGRSCGMSLLREPLISALGIDAAPRH